MNNSTPSQTVFIAILHCVPRAPSDERTYQVGHFLAVDVLVLKRFQCVPRLKCTTLQMLALLSTVWSTLVSVDTCFSQRLDQSNNTPVDNDQRPGARSYDTDQRPATRAPWHVSAPTTYTGECAESSERSPRVLPRAR